MKTLEISQLEVDKITERLIEFFTLNQVEPMVGFLAMLQLIALQAISEKWDKKKVEESFSIMMDMMKKKRE